MVLTLIHFVTWLQLCWRQLKQLFIRDIHFVVVQDTSDSCSTLRYQTHSNGLHERLELRLTKCAGPNKFTKYNEAKTTEEDTHVGT